MYSLAIAAKVSGQEDVWLRYREEQDDYPQVVIMNFE
jgi:hypothetical protein